MTRAFRILAALALLAVPVLMLWHKHAETHRASVTGAGPESPASAAAEAPRPGDGSPPPGSLAALLRERCQREGIPLEVAEVQKPAPRVPAQFSAEADGPWPKVISKLEDRYGYVPVYPRGSVTLTNAPERIVQVGSYLYLGRDESEIAALKLLADGSVEERSAALDRLGEDGTRAVPLLLALQKADPEPQIRIEAAQRLQGFPTERVINGLVQALGDKDDAVRAAARASLVWIGNERVLGALRVAANDPNEPIAQMAQAILKENLERH